jgi:Protein of unknown function (DUF4065)
VAWGSPQPPSLRELIAYVVERARGRDTTLNRTKLVKVLYLIDVESVAHGAEPVTGLRWVFFHYGPFAPELERELDGMEGHQIVTRPFHQAVLYAAAPGAPDSDQWPAAFTARVNRVVDRWAGEELNPLLDYVYFETAPMEDAVRGEPLDLERARGRRERRYRPLVPPPRPEDADRRIERWLERRRADRRSGILDPAPSYDEAYWRSMRATSGYPEGDPGDVDAEGVLEVSEDIEL